MSNSHGLKHYAVLGNDFSVSLDDKGDFSATDSFTAPFEIVQTLMPKLGSPCARSGWGWLSLCGWDMEEPHGGTVKVNLRYNATGKEASFDPDEAGAEEFQTSTAIAVAEEPIETHYRYKDVSKRDKAAISDYKSGNRERVAGTNPDHENFYRLIKTGVTDDKLDPIVINDPLARELLDYIDSGILSYSQKHITWRSRYTDNKAPTAAMFNKVGKIHNPKGAPTVSDDRNWLLAGFNTTQSGKMFTYELEYILSGRGGWDEKLYGD